MIRGQPRFCRIESRSLLPTLLFLSGTLCDERVWSETHRALGREWPCAFADYRHETSITAMATTALKQAEGPIIPIGISMGGIVALEIWRLAAERVTALALFDTDPGADTPERRAKRAAQIGAAMQDNFREIIELQLVPGYFSSVQAADESRQISYQSLHDTVIAMALDQGVNAFIAQANALATRPDSWPLLSNINVPTLIACGADDRVCLPETHLLMASRLPTMMATFRSIPAAGHLPPLEQPEATTRLLQTWLEGLACRNAPVNRKSKQ